MDPNLLPDNLRGQEGKEQAKLKKQPAGFGLELNLPGKESVSRKPRVKKPGWWSNLFGRPVSPIVNYSNLNNPPANIPWTENKTEWKLPQQNLAKATPFAAPKKQAGDSWSEIFKGMFSFGRRKRIDFRLASFGNNKKAAPVFAPMPQIVKAKDFVPYHAVTAPTKHIEPAKKAEKAKAHETKEVKSAYHTVPKSEGRSGFNVNLMPEELLNQLKSDSAKNLQSIIIAIIIPVIIVTIGYGAVILLQNDLRARMIAKNIEFDKLNKQIGDYVAQEKNNNAVADRVTAIKKLLDEKIIWNNFFSYLEDYTLDGVYFTDLTADTSGALILPGVAENYDVLAKQLAVLRDADKFVKSVKLSNAQIISEGKAGVIGVGFQVRLILQDSVFKKTK